jgi:hypothetical protein
MIVTDVGLDRKVTAIVYVAARAPDAGADYTALAKAYPTPPATAGIAFHDDCGQLSEEAFLRDFAGGPAAGGGARPLCGLTAVQKIADDGKGDVPPGEPSRPTIPCPPKSGRAIPTCSALWPSEWVRRRSRLRRAN